MRAPAQTRLIIADTDESHPFVQHELLTPIVGIVRYPDVQAAIDGAVRCEHGYGHTASMWSRNLDHLHAMARVYNTSICGKNASNFAGLGHGGEGHTSFTIASPTGEGLTTALSFSRDSSLHPEGPVPDRLMVPLRRQSLPTAACVGGLELDSLARSARCIDSLMKAASVRLLSTETFSQGRLLLLFDGGIEEVERAQDAALHIGGQRVIDHFTIQALDPGVVAGLAGDLSAGFGAREALLFLETSSLCSQIRGLDAAFKAVECHLVGLRLGRGIAGKANFVTCRGSSGP